MMRTSFAMPLAAALALLTSPTAASQTIQLGDDATLALSGGIQPRVGYAAQDVGAEARTDDRLGFGLRRARLQFNLSYRGRAGMEYDIDTAPGDVRSVDLFGYYTVSETVQVRAGRLPVAQPRAYVPTSYTRLDAVDRAVVVERWADGTIGSSGRDLGAELVLTPGATEIQVSVHNGTGSFARGDGNFRESGSSESVTRGVDRTALAVGASVHHALDNGVSFGGFAGYNATGGEATALNDVQRSYGTASAHLYWGERAGSQPVRVKLDAIGIGYETVGGVGQQSLGVSGLGAVRVLGHGEVFVRGERYWDDVDGPAGTFGTVGASYSASAARGQDYRNVRLTAGYTIREDAFDDIGHLFVVQGQLVF